jgi:hypothetical protein
MSRQVKAVKVSSVALCCVSVRFVKSRQLRLVQAARSPVRHGMAVESGRGIVWLGESRFVKSRQFRLGTAWYDEDWCGSYGTSRHDDACHVGARCGTFASSIFKLFN